MKSPKNQEMMTTAEKSEAAGQPHSSHVSRKATRSRARLRHLWRESLISSVGNSLILDHLLFDHHHVAQGFISHRRQACHSPAIIFVGVNLVEHRLSRTVSYRSLLPVTA